MATGRNILKLTEGHLELEEARKNVSLEPSEAVGMCGQLDFELRGSRAAREYILVVLSHVDCGRLFL